MTTAERDNEPCRDCCLAAQRRPLRELFSYSITLSRELAVFNLRWSANPQVLPSINTYLTNTNTGDKKALVHQGVATLGLQGRKEIVWRWLNSLA